MRLRSTVATLLAVATLPLAAAACSSGATQDSTAAGATTAAVTSTDPNAGLLTGTQLKAALPPASLIGVGFSLNPTATRDTGDTYEAPSDANLSKPDCTKLLAGPGWVSITGITGVSFAQNDYLNKDTTEEVAQEIDVFQGTTAGTLLTTLGKLSALCPSVMDTQTSSKVTVTEHATAGLGDGAYTITLTDPAWASGTTLVAARVGTALVTVESNANSGNGNASAMKVANSMVGALKGKA